ncbi:MAG: ATP-binding cassette domain-containing protein, partial [Bacteroidetes bacterium]
KSKQATSRKKMIEKLNIEEIKPSNRKYPGIIFAQEREAGDQILITEGLSYTTPEGKVLFKDLTINVNKGDKIALISRDSVAVSAFYQIVNGELEPTSGTYKWGVTITTAYLPMDNHHYFQSTLNLVDWLRQYAPGEKDETHMRGFLGRMLFAGDEPLKQCNVLSGGEKMRCMISRMMLTNANVLMLDEPTNHLDLEAIIAFNNSLKDYKGTVLFTSHDREFVQTVANRIIEITPKGAIDRYLLYDEYLENAQIKEMKTKMYV